MNHHHVATRLPDQPSARPAPGAYPESMTSAHAHELPADDPGAVAEAVHRAAAGERVRLVADDGRPVADVVPATETDIERGDRVMRKVMATTGAVPTLEHYRRVYASAGAQWPGDDVARSWFPVADAS
jgi:antitoxin (DNA-binding transcriptional repressor) of toxin-antitoxin stability system